MVCLMNRGNQKINVYAVRQLSVASSDRVLEIGFGGGSTLRHLIDKGRYLAAVDRSRVVIRRAESRFSQDVAVGKATFHEGTVDSLPFGQSSFDKILTVNTVYFWESLDSAFREIHRVVAPQGVMVVAFLPKEFMDKMGMPADIFTSRTTEEIVTAVKKAGFSDVQIPKPELNRGWAIVKCIRLMDQNSQDLGRVPDNR
jgi:ubiquinone/menaquinone biosynthesis C-methylase UbiE